MKIKNYNLEEILIGKDFFAKKENSTIIYAIYIFLLFLFLIVIFSIYFEIDIKVNGFGIIENKIKISIIKNKIPGKVSYKPFETGDELKKGEVILRLDDSEINEKINNLNEKLKENEELKKYLLGDKNFNNERIEEYNLMKNNILLNLQKQNIEIQKIKKELKNIRELYELGGVSRNSLERLEKDYKLILKDINILENQIKSLKLNQLEKIENNIENILFNLRELEREREKYFLRSPIDGTLEIINDFNIGDFIGSEIFAEIIPKEKKYKLKIYVNEKDINKINKDTVIKYKLNDIENNEKYFESKIKYISNSFQVIKDIKYYYIIADMVVSSNINLKEGATIKVSMIYGKKSIFNYFIDYIKRN